MASTDTPTLDANEIMAEDLESAQRARFNAANNAYSFFLDTNELEVLNQIHDFRQMGRPIRRRGPYGPRGRG